MGQMLKRKSQQVKERKTLASGIKHQEEQLILNKKNHNKSLSKLKPLVSKVFDTSHIIDPPHYNYANVPLTAGSSPRIPLELGVLNKNQSGNTNQVSSNLMPPNYFYDPWYQMKNPS